MISCAATQKRDVALDRLIRILETNTMIQFQTNGPGYETRVAPLELNLVDEMKKNPSTAELQLLQSEPITGGTRRISRQPPG